MFVLTGAPGTGKSAILNRLRSELRCVDEPAREVIAEQRASGWRGTWDQDPPLFVSLLLQRSIQNYEAARAGADPAPSLTAVNVFRYEPHVLFLEPLSDIYTTDEERIIAFDDAVSFSEALRDVYNRSAYVLVDVPHTPIDARVDSVRQFVAHPG